MALFLCTACGLSPPDNWSGTVVEASPSRSATTGNASSGPLLSVVNHQEEPIDVYVNGAREMNISARGFAASAIDVMEGDIEVVVKGLKSGKIWSKKITRERHKAMSIHIK